MDGDQLTVIPNDRGERITPSVVAVSDSGDFLVGTSARNQALANPGSAVFGLKRLLGQRENAIMGGQPWPPEELASKILHKVKTDAEHYLGFEIREAVLTVPARFSDPQRRAIRKAASLAGLKTARIMNEPTGAALARVWSGGFAGAEQDVLVYDFGGGTFDVTVLHVKDRFCNVLASEGNPALGGMDLDTLVFEWAKAAFKKEFGIDVQDDPYLSRHLLDLCEKAKVELSTRPETVLAIPFLKVASTVVHPAIKLTRNTFEGLVTGVIEKSLSLTSSVLEAAGVTSSGIGALVLSGGSSRIPLIVRRLGELGFRKPDPRINPEEIVVMGAALEAARLEGRLQGFSFVDVSSRTYGLEIEGGDFIPLIRKNTPIPALGRREFTTVEDFQKSVELHVLQYAAEDFKSSISVGRFLLPGIRSAKKGVPRILVDFSIDDSDILKVRAMDIDTKVRQSVIYFEELQEKTPLFQRVLVLANKVHCLADIIRMDAPMKLEVGELLEKARESVRNRDDAGAEQICALLTGMLSELSTRAGMDAIA